MTKLKFAQLLALSLIISLTYFSVTASAQPGTPEDPLVSRSYLESRIAQLEAQIAALSVPSFEAPLEVPTTPAPSVGRELFQVVRAEPGMFLIGGASTEIILRAGEATVVAGANGLANVTSGIDVMNGQSVQLNHLLIVPQDDGRGLRLHTVSYLMVKGDFYLLYG